MATKDARLTNAGVTGYNKPKATPGHPTKSHVVVAKAGDQVKTIRFGQQGVKGSPEGSKRNESSTPTARQNYAPPTPSTWCPYQRSRASVMAFYAPAME